MTAPRPWTKADDAMLKKLHAKPTSLHAISKEMRRSKQTISVKAKALGLSFDRTVTAAATSAFSFDRKAARARIIEKMYTRAEFLVDGLASADSKGFMTLVPVGGGEQRTQTLKHVPTGDERNTANAIASYLARAEALEKIDMDGGMAEAKGMVGSILTAIRESVSGVERMNPTAEAK